MQKNPIAPAPTLTYNKDIRIRREMDSLKIAVCDDDTFFLRQAEHAVKRWAEEQDLTVELQLFDNGDSLLTASRTEQFDVLLLDIMMPLFNGMELAHVIRKTNTAVKIVFLTSSPEFAVESYDVKASGYLLKPLRYEKLCSVLDDCKAPQDEESPTSSPRPLRAITRSILARSNVWRRRTRRRSFTFAVEKSRTR